MSHASMRPVYLTQSWHAQTIAPTRSGQGLVVGEAANPALGVERDHMDCAPASEASVSAGFQPLRDPSEGARFCDTFNAGLGLDPTDLTNKVDMMCSSPLKLSRCVPALYMSDILGPYANLAQLSDKPAPVVWINGDCHWGNFGIVESKQGNPVWGLNDFDMASHGAPYMDLDRLAFSLVSTMRQRGMSDVDTSAVVGHLAKAYTKEMHELAEGKDGGMAYLNAHQASGPIKHMIEKAAASDPKEVLSKYASQGPDKQWHFFASDKIQRVDAMTAKSVSDALHDYDQSQGAMPSVKRPLQVLDVAKKLESGGSSYGQPRYYALVEAADAHQPPVILEVKQELPATLVGYTGDNAAAMRASKPNWTGNLHKADATQVVAGQLAMGGDQNPLSGTTCIDGISYLVREREPVKDTLSDKHLATVDDFTSLADQAGVVLAMAHGRSQDQAQSIVRWMGDAKDFAKNLDAFAQVYASQAEADVAAYRVAHPQASPEHGSDLTGRQD